MSELVISAAALAERLDGVRIVDVRDAWEFDGIGHVPGAVNIPFDQFRADEHATEDGGDTGMLPGEEAFATLLGDRGITREDHLVAYDDHHGVFAARFLVTALLYGHPVERLHLLDGDFSAWQRGHEVTSESPTVEPTTYEVMPPAETPLVGIDAVESAVDDEETVIVDTREQWEYEEGHIPGAVRLDWRELVDDESRGLLPRDRIDAILAGRDISRDRRVLLYCNTARRISHTYWVLRWLGFEHLAFYEGSLTQWKAAGRPIEG
jgi:thiosulfate/3-mercaptopyruvate sulfurtransferase